MDGFFFDNWMDLVRTAVVGLLAYVGLVFLLRISGKRSLTKMNAFDLVVTVALGSTLATILLSKDVSLAKGMVAFVLLIFLQYAITWLSVRSRRFQRLIKAEPTLLVHRGRMLESAMRSERISRVELDAALRASGLDSAHDAEAVVLETDGSVTVLKELDPDRDASTLEHVQHINSVESSDSRPVE